MVRLIVHSVFVYGIVGLSTKLAKSEKPIIQQRGFSEKKIRTNLWWNLQKHFS